MTGDTNDRHYEVEVQDERIHHQRASGGGPLEQVAWNQYYMQEGIPKQHTKRVLIPFRGRSYPLQAPLGYAPGDKNQPLALGRTSVVQTPNWPWWTMGFHTLYLE